MVPVFDIEAIEWVNPIAVGFFDGEEYMEFLKINDECDVIWEFLKYIGEHCRGIRIYAHNAANYDNKFILDSLTKHKEEVKFIAGLGKLVWVRTDISFEDSYLLLCRSLAVCCEAFDVPRKLEWKHDETVNPWEMGSNLETFRAYLKRDCIALSQIVDKFSEMIVTNFGVTPSSTLALTAVKAFDKRFFKMSDISANTECEQFIRAATYGSRNEVYKRYGEGIRFYDVKRMFMSCYDVPVPTGKMRWVNPRIDRGVLAEALVKVPDMQVGPLPYRYQGRLIYPVGTFKGWWDMTELRYATKLGVDVKLIRQLDCDERPILEPFKNIVNELSESVNADLGRIWKLFGLRLCGKLGQHRTRTEIRHIKDLEGSQYAPIDKSEIYHEVTTTVEGSKSPYIKPAVNMRIRAEARKRHLAKMLQAKDIYYSDTDSIYTTSEMPVGDNLGDLKLVDFAVRGYFVGCKFYGYVNTNGVLKQKTAGYRDYQLTEYDLKRVLKGEEIPCSFKRIGDWREVLRGEGVNVAERRFTYRQSEFANRIMGEVETSPIKLSLTS